MILRLNRYINVRAVAIAVMMMMTSALHVVAQSPAAGDTCRRNGVSSELSIAAAPSLVLRSNPFLRGHNRMGKPVSASLSGRLQYAMRFAPDSEYGRLYPYAWQGIGLGVTSFSASGVLGSPVALYVLQGSRIASVTQRLAFDYEWNFGASFGWKHSSSTDAADRLLYGVGSSVNAYIGLAFMLSYEATPRLTLRFGPEIAHYSNGNTSLPIRVSIVWDYACRPHIACMVSGLAVSRPTGADSARACRTTLLCGEHGANGATAPRSTNRIPARERLRCRDAGL